MCLGLKVPASLGALDPEPPLRTELLAEEDGGLSGDCPPLSSFLTGEPGAGDDKDLCS